MVELAFGFAQISIPLGGEEVAMERSRAGAVVRIINASSFSVLLVAAGECVCV